MNGAADFAKMVPGFDFLQNLMKGAGAGLPQISQWIAPTLDPAELDKRIQDLKTVQFWLEQNTRLLGTTIQALEVQRMTLNTLKTMNVPLADLGAALRMSQPETAPPAAPLFTAASAWPSSVPAPSPVPSAAASAAPPPPPAPAEAQAANDAPPAAVDPMRWWGALTQQFTDIAAQAMKDTGMGTTPPAGNPPRPTASSSRARPQTAAGKSVPKSTRSSTRKSTGKATQPAATATKRGRG